MPTSDSPAMAITPCTLDALGACFQSWDVFLLKRSSEVNVQQQYRRLTLSVSAECATDLWWLSVTRRHAQWCLQH